jgi:hypothetical protein
MKTRLPIMILLSVILLFVCCTGYLYAGNPTSYVTIHDPYFRVAEGSTSYAFAQTLQVLYGGYIPYFRMFIPPGTIVLDLLIQEGGKQMAMSHHETPPTTPLPSGYSEISKKYTLDQLEAGDCLSTESLQGNLYIAHDSFLPPYLPLSRGGWLYVKVGGGSYSQVYYTMFTVEVNTKIYNEWWDKYMAKPDGTNNWNRDVESVVEYVVGPTTPGKPVVDPPSGTVFSSSSPAGIKVTSPNATQIYYTLMSSTDGSLPVGVLPDPLLTSNPLTKPFEGKLVTGTGTTGTVILPIPGGLKTMYKVKFQGLNAFGDGEVSDELLYTVYGKNGSTIKQADAKINRGVDYSDLIRTPDGLLDPSQKFLIPELKSALSEYSVQDLVLEYLKKLLPNVTIESEVFTSGIVMIVRDASWKGTIVPLIVEKISGNAGADTDINKIVVPSGNIEIIYRNILIVLNMAGAYEDQLTKMMGIDGLKLEYGSGHLVVISSDSNQDFKLVYRYQFGAVEPTPLLSGDNCTVAVNADDTYQITYGNGTTQNLIPGVIDADVLINLMKDKGINTTIDPTKGYFTTNGTWTGLPYYYLGPPQIPKDGEAYYTPDNHTPADDKIVFYSTTGTQVIKKQP